MFLWAKANNMTTVRGKLHIIQENEFGDITAKCKRSIYLHNQSIHSTSAIFQHALKNKNVCQLCIKLYEQSTGRKMSNG